MFARARFLRLGVLLWSISGSIASSETVGLASVPDWVEVASLSPSAARLPLEGETDYALVDHQIRIVTGSEHYQRYAQRLQNAQQVAEASRITIDFRPGLEGVAIHEVVVWRDGARIDQWNAARRAVLHRERELEQGIVDDSRTLTLILGDIRVGDTLDYSYTLTRNHRLTDGRFAISLRTKWNAHIDRQRVRVLHDADRPIRYVLLNETQAPEIRSWGGGGRELQWNWRALVPEPVADREPAWYSSTPIIQLSEFQDWNEVARWAVPAYRTSGAMSEGMQGLRQRIAAEASEAEQIIASLRFVQDEIRYTAISIGEGAYVPAEPDIVLERRYGDCKDKVLLFITLLRSLGIDADAALVNARWPLGRDMRLPGPIQFDHVIARVRSGGRTYWLDPTVTGQGGDLERVAPPRFGAALVVDPQTRELDMIPVQVPESALIETRERYDLSRGPGLPAHLVVKTIYRGHEADAMRQQLQLESRNAMGDRYLDYYSARFPNAKSSSPVDWSDDRSRNEIEVRESYELPEYFAANGASEAFEVVAYGIGDALPAAPAASRTQPLGLAFPQALRHEIEVLFADDWPVESGAAAIVAPGFAFELLREYGSRRLRLVHEFRTTADHVASRDLAVFREKIESVQDEMYFALTQPSGRLWPASGDVNPVYVAISVVFLALGGAFARHLWLRRPAAKAPAPDDGPSGLGGWMVIVVINVLVTPIVSVVAIHDTMTFLHQSIFANAGSGLAEASDARWLKAMVLVWVAVAWARLPVDLTTAGLMLARRRGFPTAWLWSNWSAVGFLLLSVLILLQTAGGDMRVVSESVAGLATGAVSTAIWTAYILSSRRVRATFVRDRALGRDEARAATGVA